MKKQGGTEKKNKKQAVKKDAFHLFAEKVRDHKDFVSRWAVLQEIQVEYFRGKDFVSFMRNHSELKDIIESDRSLEPEEIANILLKKTLIVRCDRVVKTVQPGKKKLSTFPAHLEIYNYQVFSDNDAFFVWAFVKRRPLWQTVLPFFWSFFDISSLLLSCVSQSGQTAYTLPSRWCPPPYTVESHGLWCSLDSSWKSCLVFPQHSC
ncbi:uncharacterized protein LOC132643587 [Lycium barbarum]|uniref:uncharacterized protein LOC132643587 n=1 Tax=Lycium barbarum TaxID=112863 RepID=UPI00293E725E|nr:uncharacterized protein LOC132643587 [Lycium barbarum]XP_060216034.1 uncharacterized protein LOC132643587 [Lycium barbarum]